jgi:DNA replication protein DnaC
MTDLPIDERLKSRLREMCTAILVEGDDYRELIKGKRGKGSLA